MVCYGPEQQPITSLPGQQEVSAVAAHEMHEHEDQLCSIPSYHLPCASGVKNEMEVLPKLKVSQEIIQCTIDDVLPTIKKAHTCCSYLQIRL